jgi:hypothetical protein
MTKRDLGTPDCHPRPRHFRSETTVIDNLMTTPWWYQHEITGLLLGDINIARSCCKFFDRHCMGFQVQFLAQRLKILGHKRGCGALSHKPKGRSTVFGITHKIVSERGAEIFVAWCKCISYTEVAHQSLYAGLRMKVRIPIRTSRASSPARGDFA